MLSPGMTEKLNAQITHEYYSGYLYRQMAARLGELGLTVLRNRFALQADEEHVHASKLVDYLQKAGGSLRLGRIEAPPHDYEDALTILRATIAHEREVTRRIHDLVAQAEADKDYSTRSYLTWYIDEQVEEEASFVELLQWAELANGNWLALEERLERSMPGLARPGFAQRSTAGANGQADAEPA